MPRDDIRPTPPASLAGSLLLAHPTLRDPHFSRTVLLIAAHTRSTGAIGVILNRPQNHALQDTVAALESSPLGPLPMYQGGPVEPTNLLFAGWSRDRHNRRFQLHFGLEREAAETLRQTSPDASLRAFAGHAGWSAGQLEQELAASTWIVCRIDPDKLLTLDGRALWRALVHQAAPGLALLADSPDHPDRN